MRTYGVFPFRTRLINWWAVVEISWCEALIHEYIWLWNPEFCSCSPRDFLKIKCNLAEQWSQGVYCHSWSRLTLDGSESFWWNLLAIMMLYAMYYGWESWSSFSVSSELLVSCFANTKLDRKCVCIIPFFAVYVRQVVLYSTSLIEYTTWVY